MSNTSLFRKWRQDEVGSTAMIYAIILPVLIGMGALAIDVGHFEQRNARIQSAADLAALAAALEYQATNDRDKARLAGKGDAYENGYIAQGGSIEVESPITTGPFAGSEGAVVRITQKQDRYLSSIFPNQKDVVHVVEATVVAAEAGAGSPACVLSLNETATRALELRGNTRLNFGGCGAHSNSTANGAIDFNGNSSITAECISTRGTVTGAERAANLQCDAPKENSAAVADPYADVMVNQALVSSLPCQDPPSSNGNGGGGGNGKKKNNNNNSSNDDPFSIGPSVPGGPVRFCGGRVSINETLTLAPGTYYFDDADLRFTGQGGLDASPPDGVTLVFLNGGELDNINGGEISIRAQSTGPFAGIAVFRDPDSSSSNERIRINGNQDLQIDGALYFPNGDLEFSGGADATSGCTQIIADTVIFTGNSELTLTDCEPLGTRDIDGPGSTGSGVKLVK
ncbi:pilus assembly protein TadG-related protein [Hellea sp.]|nr:pilus assembly protein TadG-related protein [Hellea sp.]